MDGVKEVISDGSSLERQAVSPLPRPERRECKVDLMVGDETHHVCCLAGERHQTGRWRDIDPVPVVIV